MSTTESIDILVDDSPPEPGVALEGSIDENDIDYTSESSFIVHWYGFIDHESGIKMYRVAIAKSCLTTDDIETRHQDAILQYKELPSTEHDDIECFKHITNLTSVFSDEHNLVTISINETVPLPVNKFTSKIINNVVYDFDNTKDSWKIIEKLLESQNLGNTIPPSEGFVHITSSNEYIIENEVDISWNGFHDNIDARLVGYPSDIRFYAYQVGSRKGIGDIQPLRDIRHNEKLMYKLTDQCLDGMKLYISITAYDYSGLSSSSTSEEFIIDRSPPSVGKVVIERDDRPVVYVASERFAASVRGFQDNQSGIKNFEFSIGSKSDIEDFAQHIVYQNDFVNIDGTGLFIDGHQYFLFAKARPGYYLKLQLRLSSWIKRHPKAAKYLMATGINQMMSTSK
ncbi:hypothetical protein DPMN_068341 [Dreissena polymorpha]|uniref:Uncharacterized protein n=1 Tax=Dreissena polymorpha TaxID=45954 RepID=A0A9D3Z229_DREPO|nr:hypothetical protein DPMN_068341 [Dreissena polymorpha]